MTVVVIVEGVLLAVALVFVFALLRSHAEILRRLAAIEGGAGGVAVDPLDSVPTDARAVAGIAGQTPDGDAVAVSLGPGSPPTLLAFLSTGCASCGPLWDELRERTPVPAPTRLLVVTKGPDRESPAKVRRLGPTRAEVVMSTAAWDEFEIPATPHFVLVGGAEGRVLGRGSAMSWEQILGLLDDVRADAEAVGSEPGTGRSASDGPGGSSSSDRAARAEAALAAAGIRAGHPSLYPSRAAAGRE